MEDEISIERPIELIEGNLVLRIPLSAGGDELAPLARKITEVQGDYLCLIIQPWLAEKLRMGAGSLVVVSNKDGKFNIARSAKNDYS